MSDEHEEHDHSHGHPFMVFQAGPSAEELDHMRMQAEANGHDLRQFLMGLKEDQLQTLYAMIGQIRATNGGAGIFYQGIISQRLEADYNVCMGCGKKHDEDFANIAASVPTKPEPVAPVEPTREPRNPFPVKGSATYDQLMTVYGMEADDDGSDRVMCVNCGSWYVNLEDRTQRPAGKSGCAGCIQKEKWG